MVHLLVICLFLHCKSVASLVVAGLESDQTLLPTLSRFSKAGKFCGCNPCVCSELRRAKNFTIAIAAKITSDEAPYQTGRRAPTRCDRHQATGKLPWKRGVISGLRGSFAHFAENSGLGCYAKRRFTLVLEPDLAHASSRPRIENRPGLVLAKYDYRVGCLYSFMAVNVAVFARLLTPENWRIHASATRA
jgi:hypothetical protein